MNLSVGFLMFIDVRIIAFNINYTFRINNFVNHKPYINPLNHLHQRLLREVLEKRLKKWKRIKNHITAVYFGIFRGVKHPYVSRSYSTSHLCLSLLHWCFYTKSIISLPPPISITPSSPTILMSIFIGVTIVITKARIL